MTTSALVVSPHFDDAVLSAGGKIARLVRTGVKVTIVTAYGGVPAPDLPVSDWDSSCGFADGAEAALWRQREDHRAAALLGAAAIHLPDLDGPYRDIHHADALAQFLAGRVHDFTDIYVPAAIGGHPDHVSARDAALASLPAAAQPWLYVDLPYADRNPAWLMPELATAPLDPAWERDDLPPVRARFELGAPEIHQLDRETWIVKLGAVLAYGSQLASLAPWHGTFHARGGTLSQEMIWPLSPRNTA